MALHPDIQKALAHAGLGDKDKSLTIQDRLNDSNLNLGNTLDSLGQLMEGGETGSIRMRAIETSLKLHGVLKEAQSPAPSVTIIIKDAKDSDSPNINPILIPRSTVSQKVQ